MKINIIGHKNPDTDSIVSSIILKDVLEKKKGPFNLDNFQFKATRSGKLNKETKFVLSRFKEKAPSLVKSGKKKKVFLVDHGSYEESIKNIEEAEIFGVLDHHRLGGINTSCPIFYRAEPLGATSTILAKIFFENNISLSKKKAGMLLAGILSDTLNLTSPTTTKTDKKIAEKLSEISGEDKEKLSQKMFQEKSDISDISFSDLIKKDYKEFESSGTKFGIGVWETTNTEKIKEKKKEIISALKKFKKERKLDFLFFASVNILKKESDLFLIGEKESEASKVVFKKKINENIMFLPDVVSRKKQILPPLFNHFKK